MAKYQMLYGRDIPAQLKAYEGSRPISQLLSERFEVEIDRVSMKEGLVGSRNEPTLRTFARLPRCPW